MRRTSLATLALLAVLAALASDPSAARAQAVVTPADRTALGLIVYPGFGQVRDTRRVPGADDLLWTGISRGLDAATLVLLDGETPVAVASQSVDVVYGPYEILRAAEGQEVVLVSPTGERIPAIVVTAEGPIYRVGERMIFDWKGHVEVPAPARVPAMGATARFRLERGAGGALTASYLAHEMDWSAEYVAILDETSMWFRGTAMVRNGSETAFPDAELSLVAGDVQQAGGARPPMPMRMMREEAAVGMAAGDMAQREAFGDWHLYRIEGRQTIAARSTASIPLFEPARVPIERTYLLTGQPYWYQDPSRHRTELEHPRIRIAFVNDDVAGREEPPPGGRFQAYRAGPDGKLLFAGSDRLQDTPDGERAEVDLGSAFDVVAERTRTDYRQLDERTWETAWRIEVRNRGETARTVEVVETFPGQWEILEESHPHERRDASTARWRLNVPAGGGQTLVYRVRVTS